MKSTATATNPYKEAAQLRKATRLVDMLRQIEATPEQVANMTDDQWLLAAKAAEVKPASLETRHMVIDAMERTRKSSIRKNAGMWVASVRGTVRSFQAWADALRFVQAGLNPFSRY